MVKNIFTAQKGFTLIELLAVLAIIGVLAGIVTTSVGGTKSGSQTAQVQQDAQSSQSATDNFKSADVTGTISFPDRAMANSHSTQIPNIYEDVFLANGEQGTNVILRQTDETGAQSGETLGDKFIAAGETAAEVQFQFTGIDFGSAEVKTRDDAGNVITSSFVPDFMPKPPSSLNAKGDETSDLGVGQEVGDYASDAAQKNTYEEYLWLYRVQGPKVGSTRSVEVYRLAEARCSAASAPPSDLLTTTDDATASGAGGIDNRIQVVADFPLGAISSDDINAAVGTEGADNCDLTANQVRLLVYDRVF